MGRGFLKFRVALDLGKYGTAAVRVKWPEPCCLPPPCLCPVPPALLTTSPLPLYLCTHPSCLLPPAAASAPCLPPPAPPFLFHCNPSCIAGPGPEQPCAPCPVPEPKPELWKVSGGSGTEGMQVGLQVIATVLILTSRSGLELGSCNSHLLPTPFL